MKLILLLASLALQRTQPSIHYFYNSGWMIETQKHIILIDYIQHKESGITLQSLEQHLSKNKKILVLISHDHQDHFDSSIFQLADKYKNIEFVLGWNYVNRPSKAPVHILEGTTKFNGGDYIINTHPATDDGVAFLLEIDGLTIYHAGDHALWAESIAQQFTDELKAIRAKAKQIDIAFLPAARGMFTQCAYDNDIEKGLRSSIEILQPKTVALQHVGCADKLKVYQDAYAHLKGNGKIKWIVPVKYNEEIAMRY